MINGYKDGCKVCHSLSGSAPISPVNPVYESELWRVEHAHPSGVDGWLVIILKRHAEALHELTAEEAKSLGYLQLVASRVLRECFNCSKEYAMVFGEAEGFGHLHCHIVPREADLADELKGGNIFKLLHAEPVSATRQAHTVCLLSRKWIEVESALVCE